MDLFHIGLILVIIIILVYFTTPECPHGLYVADEDFCEKAKCQGIIMYFGDKKCTMVVNQNNNTAEFEMDYSISPFSGIHFNNCPKSEEIEFIPDQAFICKNGKLFLYKDDTLFMRGYHDPKGSELLENIFEPQKTQEKKDSRDRL